MYGGVKMATAKQIERLKDMYEILYNEMDFGTIGKKKFYTVDEASKLISLNNDIYWGIIDDGQCTVRQYAMLTKIAGRKPNIQRCYISFTQAVEWINKYNKVSAKVKAA